LIVQHINVEFAQSLCKLEVEVNNLCLATAKKGFQMFAFQEIFCYCAILVTSGHQSDS